MYKRLLLLVLLLSACGVPESDGPSGQIAQMSTDRLWVMQSTQTDPRILAFVEAELGVRGSYTSGTRYLGSRSAAAQGRSVYTRVGSALATTGSTRRSRDLRNCSDFSSSAAAQKYFLSSGGPRNDPDGLDADGDGLACEWGTRLKRNASQYRVPRVSRVQPVSRPRPTYRATCYTGPRGGRYTLTASGNKNYGGC